MPHSCVVQRQPLVVSDPYNRPARSSIFPASSRRTSRRGPTGDEGGVGRCTGQSVAVPAYLPFLSPARNRHQRQFRVRQS